MTAVQRAFADVDGRRLHYRYAGKPGLPTLLMLHQTPSSSLMYGELMGLLAERFWLLAPDTPGFGDSEPLPEVSIAAYANAIAGLLREVKIPRCFVFGHHTGAAIAVQLAYDFPGLAASLALSGPTLLSEAQRLSLPELASALPPVADGSHLQAMWQRIRDKDPHAPLALSHRELLSAFACGDAYQASYRAVTRQDFAAQLAALDLPVLVFAGDRDPLHAAVEPSLALLRRGRGATLEGGEATYVCERQAGLVASLLADFFVDDDKPT